MNTSSFSGALDLRTLQARQWRGSVLLGPRELVGQTAGFVRQALGTVVVAGVDGVPVADLDLDIPTTTCDLLGLDGQVLALRSKQHDLVLGSLRSECPV